MANALTVNIIYSWLIYLGGYLSRACFISVTTKRARIFVFAVEHEDHFKWMSLFNQKKWHSGMGDGPDIDFDRYVFF